MFFLAVRLYIGMAGGPLLHHCGPDWSISTIIRWTGTEICEDIHYAQTMNPADFDDPLAFCLAAL